jgi:hypothetical protein
VSTQPEALWLADVLDAEATVLDAGRPPDSKSTKRKAAAELRRQHAVNAELLEALRVAVLALAHANTETAPGLYVDAYNKVSAAIARAEEVKP